MAMTDLCDPEKEIEISVFGTDKKQHIKQIELVNIIQTRLIEIFEFLKHKIISNELSDKAICGIVLTGGVCELKGTAELCEKILELPVKPGKPLNVTGINEQIKSPVYATGIGLLKYAFENENQKIGPPDENLFDRIIKRLKDMFMQIFLKF
jgi:cell division protein FtsA